MIALPGRLAALRKCPTLPCHAPGYGITCVLEGGDLLEKAAANISIIHGQLSAQRAQVRHALPKRGLKARSLLCARCMPCL